eukprot:TRINITY_DN1779_c0_g1_i2.p1 TRINITY_DN1779_c0_g1~~TRINITY_DN1779_c0_g1_i2.p1  ORF type:complete len:443 (+),score=72.71 TRINITY_DN1779_c0_g1_i2:232-1560(+)
MKDPNLGILFGNCLPNTLDTTVQNFTANSSYYGGGPDTFVITGDITAMWLRDSSGQVYPYVDYVTQDPELQTLILGVIGRQIRSINIDQYANAFNYQPTPNGPHMNDIVTPPMTDALYESKYELDSLAWVLRLMSHYWEVTEDDSFCNSNWTKAMETVLATIEYQQKPLTEMETTDELYYSFQRQTYSQIDTTMQSLGQPAAYCGLSRSPFRPSDDAQILPYPIAANAMASVSLSGLSRLASAEGGACYNLSIAEKAATLSKQLRQAVIEHGIVLHPSGRRVFAYEVDCYGSHTIMDDANVPSLLSLPYLGFLDSEGDEELKEVYQNTREILLADTQPYYFAGTEAAGIGSPHTGYEYIWPLSLIIQASTSEDDKEISGLLDVLKSTTADTGFMHESFYKNNASDYSRSWFAWANSQFGQLIIKIAHERPYLIFKNSTVTDQ